MDNEHPQHTRPKRWIACSTEEEYFGSSRKQSRMERKRLSAKDRSKYKKTDRKKAEAAMEQEIIDKRGCTESHRGRVLSITPQGMVVEHEGKTYTCSLRGLLKKEKRPLKNIVTVGDFVLFEEMPDNEGRITQVEPRRSTLSRADTLSRRKEQLIAANIDQVLITASIITPVLKPFLIDRYIIAAKKGKMEPVILVNKIDLLEQPSIDAGIRKEQLALLDECRRAYEHANIPFLPLSVVKEEGFDQLFQLMKGKASVFSGQSGTGKSSLINAMTGLNLPVGEIVHKTRKGGHTTTQAHLVPLKCGGWCIDTPGIKSFGIWDLKREELEGYFQEIYERGRLCRFPDCSHLHEKGCAVINDVENGAISSLRYSSYQSLMETVVDAHQRR
ncbi:MAG: ribosome small subunit-dependent GTPase A [Waddliaceae bacterium]